ncbi:hypothetical protein CSV77_13820 [Sporosarcina sp. P16b]|uniref:hypothetical protein n=1 Tax=Sporosarcina sp. P16b TaxID=2048261 RepID=UPI000C168B67|nr:hypothetical protein [Sporosarcina sp. P16b]PIC69366.1 hypothetical protein CSV77_13820 [Sporosarcina sp. P16b]
MESDVIKKIIKGLCKVNDISPRRVRFESIEGVVIISVKNHLKDGVDLECFHILNLIYQVITPFGVKFNQQLYLYPNSKRVARITVLFQKEEYDSLNMKMENCDIDN